MSDSYKYRITGTDDYGKVFLDKVSKTWGDALAEIVEDAYVGDNNFPQFEYKSPIVNYEIRDLKTNKLLVVAGKEKNSAGETYLELDANEMY